MMDFNFLGSSPAAVLFLWFLKRFLPFFPAEKDNAGSVGSRSLQSWCEHCPRDIARLRCLQAGQGLLVIKIQCNSIGFGLSWFGAFFPFFFSAKHAAKNISFSISYRWAYFVCDWCDWTACTVLKHPLLWQLEPASGWNSTGGNLCSSSLLLLLLLRFHLHTLLLSVKGRDRFHHALIKAIASCCGQVLCSDPDNKKIPWAAPALSLGQSRTQPWC